jgi:hypothetical protein
LAAAKGKRFEVAFVLLVETGMRLGELLGLRWEDVDLDEGQLQIRQTLSTLAGRIVVDEPKASTSRRPYELSPQAVEALKAHLVMGINDMVSLSADPDWLHAVTCNGGPLEIGSVLAKVWFLPDGESELTTNFGFDVAFEAMGPARGRSVYYCLADLHDVVGDLVERFRPFFGEPLH